MRPSGSCIALGRWDVSFVRPSGGISFRPCQIALFPNPVLTLHLKSAGQDGMRVLQLRAMKSALLFIPVLEVAGGDAIRKIQPFSFVAPPFFTDSCRTIEANRLKDGVRGQWSLGSNLGRLNSQVTPFAVWRAVRGPPVCSPVTFRISRKATPARTGQSSRSTKPSHSGVFLGRPGQRQPVGRPTTAC